MFSQLLTHDPSFLVSNEYRKPVTKTTMQLIHFLIDNNGWRQYDICCMQTQSIKKNFRKNPNVE